ncbi:MAG TPA: aquaporin [Candidatus Saccharimonadales bacterium]|nr:aquaporin [Candidatus Saccharimonadales bacterium]
MNYPLSRRLAAEFLGTAFLLSAVVGSGIMAERLSLGNVALALLANAIATGAALVALLHAFGPISGAHLNPSVSLLEAFFAHLPWREVPAYVAAQALGALAGVAAAHAMFALPLYSRSQHARHGAGMIFSEFIATFGLLLIISTTSRSSPATTPYAVATYITAAYWFTASTSFANPAVTLARCVTDTFAGIRPADVPNFLLAQFTAVPAVLLLSNWFRRLRPPHPE